MGFTPLITAPAQPNILISNSGQAMLSDFGIAKVLEETRTGLTTSNSTALSIRFSSPEALEGGSRDLKSDVYSFACLVLGTCDMSRHSLPLLAIDEP